MPGHGYSDGTRALITDHNCLVDDVYQFISHIIQISANPKSKVSDKFSCKLAGKDLEILSKLPFFIIGQVWQSYTTTTTTINDDNNNNNNNNNILTVTKAT